MTASTSYLALGAAWTLGGFLFGLAYFTALRRTIDLFTGGRGRLFPAALTLGRLTGVILFLGLAARVGALPLLTGFLGFLLARGLALRTARRAA